MVNQLRDDVKSSPEFEATRSWLLDLCGSNIHDLAKYTGTHAAEHRTYPSCLQAIINNPTLQRVSYSFYLAQGGPRVEIRMPRMEFPIPMYFSEIAKYFPTCKYGLNCNDKFDLLLYTLFGLKLHSNRDINSKLPKSTSFDDREHIEILKLAIKIAQAKYIPYTEPQNLIHLSGEPTLIVVNHHTGKPFFLTGYMRDCRLR